ncbi:SYC2L protein, partial [Drymodes brunneopygia]|nr:SYC2L protein [Drymodes brunneopygia]
PSEKPLEEEPMDESTPKILQLSPSPKNVTSKKRNRKTSLAKKRAEGRKEPYEFENSDSSSHEKVAEAKGKILAQRVSSQSQRIYETRSKNKELNNLERRRSSYRKHLFSESNNENTSPGQSERSWILDSQIPPLPKSVDYTRKRPRVRSKLKVLPVSSASSGSDYESKKEGQSRRRAQKETLRKKSTFVSKGDDVPAVDLADETLSEEPGGSPLLLSVSSKSLSSDMEKATQKFNGAPGKLLREEESTKRKDSDILSSTVIKKPKFSSLEQNHLPSEINHTPKKISDLVEEEGEIQKGREMDDSMDDVFFTKMLHEDLGDTGVISAFESFIGQLKKLFWTRYKRIEINTQDALRSSERNLSALLNQIHKC